MRASWTSSVITTALVASFAAVLLSGCSGVNVISGQRDKKSSTTTATSSATRRAAALKPGEIPTDALVPMIPTEALEPPSYVGYERLPCLTYHHVDPKLTNSIAITPATFEAQLKVLKDGGYQTITARQLADYHENGTPLPDKPVMITFDDGWKNQFQYAAPLLQKYGFVATFFVNPELIGRGSAYMTRDMILALNASGNDIESHTWTHLALTRRKSEDALVFQNRIKREMTLADAWILKLLGQKPVALGYPFGYYDIEAVSRAKAAGYKLGFTTDEGIADARRWDSMTMKRITIGRETSIESFQSRLNSGVLEVRRIEPPPGSRVRGADATVTVDITEVPKEVTAIKLSSGKPMSTTTIVTRGKRRYAVAGIHGARTGSRQVTMSGVTGSGQRAYASWSLVMGD